MEESPERASSEPLEWQYRNIFDAVQDGMIIIDLETGCVVEANPAVCEMHRSTREDFVGLHLTAIIHPDSQKSFCENVRTYRTGSVFDRRARHVRQDGSTFFAGWHGSEFNFKGRRCLLGVVHDISKRIQTEQLLHQRVEKRTLEQAKLLEISHTLASTLKIQPGLILGQLREIIEFSSGGLFELEDSTLVALAMRGTAQVEQSDATRIRLNNPETLATLFNEHHPIRIGDVWSDHPQAKFMRLLLDDGAKVLLEGMRSWMWVPLAVKGRFIGGVGVAHERLNYFTAHHADLALSVANQAAITMINAELYEHAQSLAVLEERQRLARNLHDAINQSLFSVGLIAEVLPRLWERDPEEARHSLEDLRRLTRGASAEMRALLAELRPSVLTDTDLGDLVHLLGNAFTGRTNIPVSITMTGKGMLPGEVQVLVYRICQEALINISKHAKAHSVEIKGRHTPGAFELDIRDDGRGFNTAEQTPPGHYGLSMMRERAEALGAQLKITSQPGHGTEIVIYWKETLKKEVV